MPKYSYKNPHPDLPNNWFVENDFSERFKEIILGYLTAVYGEKYSGTNDFYGVIDGHAENASQRYTFTDKDAIKYHIGAFEHLINGNNNSANINTENNANKEQQGNVLKVQRQTGLIDGGTVPTGTSVSGRIRRASIGCGHLEDKAVAVRS